MTLFSYRPRLVAASLGATVALLAVGSPAAATPGHDASVVRAESSPLPGMWWYGALAVEEAHKTTTGQGVTIAVIDGPIDPTVPELRGQDVTPVRNYCANPGEDPVATATGSGAPAAHATSITALLVGNGQGTGPGGAGIKGIAPDASVRNYVVDEAAGAATKLRCSDADIDTTVGTQHRAIRDAVDDGADIISVSLGVSPRNSVSQAIGYALHQDVVVVASAGNEGNANVSFPASVAGVVSVGMVNRSATVHEDSNHGDQLVVAAPGVDVSAGGYGSGQWDSEATGNGTSYSAPLVAGAIALVKSEYPDASNWQLVRHLAYRAGVDKKFDWSEYLGFGVIALNRMLEDDPRQWRDTNPFADVSPDIFIKYGDNELTGTPEQLAEYTASPSPSPGTAKSSNASGKPQSKSSESSGAVPIAVGATVTLLSAATGAGLWLRRRHA